MHTNRKSTLSLLLRPIQIIRTYDRSNLRPDIIAGLSVAVVLLPQAIAFALLAELPPQMGLYAAVIAAIVGALWGSSNQIHTGPTNAISLLVLSVLLVTATPGTPEYVLSAGIIAIMAGVFQLLMGVARLGVLVNFVSHSVVVGFTGGAGVLIMVKQLPHLFGLDLDSHSFLETVQEIFWRLGEIHPPTIALGMGTMLMILVLHRLHHKLPGAFIGMALASATVFFLGLDEVGVKVISELPSSLPPTIDLSGFNFALIAKLSTGALAVGAIGLVETSAIARTISAQTGQRLDNNQEFIGQGLANIFSGLFSGYPTAGSFSRSALNFKANAKTPLSAVFSSLFVGIAIFALAPMAVFLPRTALAAVLIITGYRIIARQEIIRILRTARDDAIIMLVTFFLTLFLQIEFAILVSILLSFAFYIMNTSVPRVVPVLPESNFKYLAHQPQKPPCPQLSILVIEGDLYFGAVNHVEDSIQNILVEYPEQRVLLLNLSNVVNCDISGIHMLESVMRSLHERNGSLYLTKVKVSVLELMDSTGFYDQLGWDHFLNDDQAISYLFYKVFDPAICIYECEWKVFGECQNLPKRLHPIGITLEHDSHIPISNSLTVSPEKLWEQLTSETPPLVVDVREAREYKRGRIPQAQLVPLPALLSGSVELPRHLDIVLVCRTGRRSARAARFLLENDYDNFSILRGGILAWEVARLLEAVD